MAFIKERKKFFASNWRTLAYISIKTRHTIENKNPQKYFEIFLSEKNTPVHPENTETTRIVSSKVIQYKHNKTSKVTL